jgi:hypothetical protein
LTQEENSKLKGVAWRDSDRLLAAFGFRGICAGNLVFGPRRIVLEITCNPAFGSWVKVGRTSVQEARATANLIDESGKTATLTWTEKRERLSNGEIVWQEGFDAHIDSLAINDSLFKRLRTGHPVPDADFLL